jgi:hypothetical protein
MVPSRAEQRQRATPIGLLTRGKKVEEGRARGRSALPTAEEER